MQINIYIYVYRGSVVGGVKIRCVKCAGDVVVLADDEVSLKEMIEDLQIYTEANDLELNLKKSTKITFRRSGRSNKQKFYLEMER